MNTYNANVVVHINETLSADETHRLEKDICDMEGIVSACVSDKTPHLMVVDYDPRIIGTGFLLSHIQVNGLHPSLIGGI